MLSASTATLNMPHEKPASVGRTGCALGKNDDRTGHWLNVCGHGELTDPLNHDCHADGILCHLVAIDLNTDQFRFCITSYKGMAQALYNATISNQEMWLAAID
jgi:hypothetical protein